jgi:hypothetical protein
VDFVRIDVSEQHFASINRVLITANFPSSPVLVALIIEAIYYSDTSVFRRTTRGNIPEEDILYSHRRENLKSPIALTGWAL